MKWRGMDGLAWPGVGGEKSSGITSARLPRPLHRHMQEVPLPFLLSALESGSPRIKANFLLHP